MLRFSGSGGTPKKQLASQPLPPLPFPNGLTAWKATDLDGLRRRARESATDSKRASASSGRNADAIDAASAVMPLTELSQNLFRTIDTLGARSQRAQNIPEVLTSVARLHENATYQVLLLCHEGHGVGILKIGVKKLFLTHPRTRAMVEVDALCVLDFFVDESCQRQGFGGELFRAMLRVARVSRPETLAIDRPSPKFLAFLKKNYHLEAYTPQANNFVAFDRFFDQTTVSERGLLRRTDGPAFGEASSSIPIDDDDNEEGGAFVPSTSARQDLPFVSSLFEPQSTALRRYQTSHASSAASPPAWLGEWERKLKCGLSGEEDIPGEDPTEGDGDAYGCVRVGQSALFSCSSTDGRPRRPHDTAEAERVEKNGSIKGTSFAPWQVPGLTTATATTTTHAPIQSRTVNERGCGDSRRGPQTVASPQHSTAAPAGGGADTPRTWKPRVTETDLYAAPAYIYPGALPPRPTAFPSPASPSTQPFSRIDLLLAQHEGGELLPPLSDLHLGRRGEARMSAPNTCADPRLLPHTAGDTVGVLQGSTSTRGRRGRLAEGLAYGRRQPQKTADVPETSQSSLHLPRGRDQPELAKHAATDSAVDYDIITGKRLIKR